MLIYKLKINEQLDYFKFCNKGMNKNQRGMGQTITSLTQVMALAPQKRLWVAMM